MRKALPALFILPALALALGGCSSLFGTGQAKSLDEFAVARNAPLVIPPDFTLTPPVAGTVSSTAESAQSQAIEALFGGPAPRSSTETSLLESAGRDRAALGARSVAGDPGTRVVDKGQTTVAIINAPESATPTASAE
jgi:Protein of unknown function (DUF3035)